MNRIINTAFYLVLLLTLTNASLANPASSNDEDFISYAAQGNLALLRRIDTKNLSPETFFMALLESVENQKIRTSKYLLESNRFLDIELQPILRAASSMGFARETDLLISHGANINEFLDGETPLMNAARAGHNDVVTLLLKKGARTDLRGKNTDLTAYDLAKAANRLSTIKIKGLKPEHGNSPAASKTGSVLGRLFPYLVSAAAIAGGYFYYKAVKHANAPEARNILAARARQVPAIEPMAPRELAGAPQNLLTQLSSLLDQLPPPLAAFLSLQILQTVRMPVQLRNAALMALHAQILQLLEFGSSMRLQTTIQETTAELKAAILAAAQQYFRNRVLPTTAPAA